MELIEIQQIEWLNVNSIWHRKLKSHKEIETLDEFTDIFCPSVIDNYYPRRPEKLKWSISFYEFIQWYNIKIKPRSKNIEYYKIDNNHCIKRRQHRCLINHYRYNVNKPENYFFSSLLMFKP